MKKFVAAALVVILAGGACVGFAAYWLHHNKPPAAENSVAQAQTVRNDVLGHYSPQAASRAEVARQNGADMRALKRIVRPFGSWSYVCNQKHSASPNAPAIQNLLDVSPPRVTMPMEGVCSIATSVPAANSAQRAVLFMRADAENRGVDVGLRYPATGVSGEFVSVLFDNKPLSLVPQICGHACVALAYVDQAKLSPLIRSQRIVATLPVPPGTDPVVLVFPTDGLEQAAIALQKRPRL